MAVMMSHISWTDSTWNPTTGCTKVSAGCDDCYAEAIVNRLWGGGFENVTTRPERLRQVHSFKPLPDGRGLKPRMVFVNSMSDLMHEDIPDAFRDQVFEAIEGNREAIFQVLTKRPMTLRRYIEARYKQSGVPSHIWLGCSVEDNRVRGRIDALRRLKDAVGPFTAFLSVEPLIGPVDRHDYTAIEWVLIGGKSGTKALTQPMDVIWARQSRDQARDDGAAVWFKQFGHWQNNPLYRASKERRHLDRIRDAIQAGEKQAWFEADENGKMRLRGEKGGATLDGEVLHELPPAYEALRVALNDKAETRRR